MHLVFTGLPGDSCRRRLRSLFLRPLLYLLVPTGSPSPSGDVAVSVFEVNQPRLPTPFYFVLVSVSVFMALSTAFHSINSPDNSPLSHSVLPVISASLVPPATYLFMKVSFQT